MAKSKQPRKAMKHPSQLINPFEFVRKKSAMESKLTEEELTRYALSAHIPLWAVLNGEADDQCNLLVTRAIVMLQILAANRQNRPMYDMTAKTVTLWLSALDLAKKRGVPPDLSTTAKKAVIQCINLWDKALQHMDIVTLARTASTLLKREREFGVNEPMYGIKEAA